MVLVRLFDDGDEGGVSRHSLSSAPKVGHVHVANFGPNPAGYINLTSNKYKYKYKTKTLVYIHV
jgi:hypothetical protein